MRDDGGGISRIQNATSIAIDCVSTVTPLSGLVDGGLCPVCQKHTTLRIRDHRVKETTGHRADRDGHSLFFNSNFDLPSVMHEP